MSKMTKQEYDEYVKQKTPNSPILKDCLNAFLWGGLICTIGQCILKLYMLIGTDEENAYTMTSMTMVFIGALLTGLDIYPKIAKHAGAGTIVPITGFSNAVSAPALEAKTEGYVLGVGAKIFTIAGPVILYGVLSSIIAGLIMYFFFM